VEKPRHGQASEHPDEDREEGTPHGEVDVPLPLGQPQSPTSGARIQPADRLQLTSGLPEAMILGLNRPFTRVLAVAGFGALASQAGHLLVYQLQFGSAALAVQSRGAHAYFPIFAKTSLGVAGLAILAALVVIGVSRALSAGVAAKVSSPSYLRLLSALFTIQIACFAVQETIESLVAGTATASAPYLVLVGALGQLPVAMIAALACKWLAARFESALITLRQKLATPTSALATATRAAKRSWHIPHPALAAACPSVFAKRGPPAVALA
jgi:hypothetical protein